MSDVVTLNIEGLTIDETAEVVALVRRMDIAGDPKRKLIMAIGSPTLSIDEAERALLAALPERPDRFTLVSSYKV